MSLSRATWKKLEFRIGRTPPWPCPSCSSPLGFHEGDFVTKHCIDLPGSIRNLSKAEIPNLDFIEYRVSGFFNCDSCGLRIATIGFAYAIDKRGLAVPHTYAFKKGKVLIPISFDPPLSLFHIPDSCPSDISNQLKAAFSHYWYDRFSAANRLRSTVELILDSLSGPAAGQNLHNRILEFKSNNKGTGNYLESIKWIGNAGSHVQNLTKDDLLDAFEMLDHVLQDLYKNDEPIERLKNLSEQVNASKAPRSHKKN